MISIFAVDAGTKVSDIATKTGSETDVTNPVRAIIYAIVGMIGVVAVIMIILGAISYATSQGDPGKVKKGKDTILYGIIGLVVALLAFAIVFFVTNALK